MPRDGPAGGIMSESIKGNSILRFDAAKAANVPEIYINGFVHGLGAGDVYTVIERNGSPVAILNMSYTVAKTFSVALGAIVARLESRSGRDMLTTQEIEEIFKESENKDDISYKND
jgi:hypothetical protein